MFYQRQNGIKEMPPILEPNQEERPYNQPIITPKKPKQEQMRKEKRPKYTTHLKLHLKARVYHVNNIRLGLSTIGNIK
jgi:hypothetical protein